MAAGGAGARTGVWGDQNCAGGASTADMEQLDIVEQRAQRLGGSVGGGRTVAVAGTACGGSSRAYKS